jgi:hypothetical protein
MTTENSTNDQTMFADGFEEAVIGTNYTNGVRKVVYDMDLMIRVLMERDEMTEEDAIEYLEYNVWNTYVGEGTPIYIQRGSYLEVMEYIEEND